MDYANKACQIGNHATQGLSPIDSALCAMREKRFRIDDLISNLESRLQPVISPVPEACGNQSDPIPLVGGHVLSSIRAETAALSKIEGDLARILNILDV